MEFIRKNVNASNKSVSGGNGGGSQNTATNTTLETHTIFGQPYNGTNDVRGNLSDVNKITANGDISTDGDLIIKGVDDEGIYTDQDLNISKDTDGTKFTGGESYHFDNTIITNNIESDSGNIKDLSAESIASAYAYLTEMMAEKGTINNLDSKKILADDISVDTLTVTKAAHFFSLIIDEIKSVGGQIILSPTNATLDIVKKTEGGNYKCYFRAQVGEEKISNQFAANDQVVCQTFNVAEGTSYNISNTFYWRLLNSRGKENINGIDYHYIILSGTDCAENSGEPKEGDRVVALGNRKDNTRQNAIILSAYNSDFLDKGLKAPSIVQYSGINDYNLTTHRQNVISNGLNQFVGNFKISSGESVTDLIQSTKYNRLILDKALAVVGFDDVLSVDISGSVLPLSGNKYRIEIISSLGIGISLYAPNNQFSYTNIKQITNYSEQEDKPTYYSVVLSQDDVVIEKINIPVIFETGALFSVMDDKIESAVQDVEGNISRVEQKADSITTTVQNMKVGGKNLLEDSEFTTYKDGSIWTTHNGEVASKYGYKNQLGVHAISNLTNVTDKGYLDLAQQIITNKLEPDTYYTFSFYAKGANGVTGDGTKYKGRITTYVYPDVGADLADNGHTFITNGKWQRYSYTFKTRSSVSPSNSYNVLFRLPSEAVGANTYFSNTYICMPKLEEGTIPTAWDISGTDMKSFITQKADSIEAKIISEDKVKSLISQNDSHIKAEVYDELNKSTGIDIKSGNITLNADNTTIKGNLNITDTNQGMILYDIYGNPKICVQNDSIGSLDSFDFGIDTYKKTQIQTEVNSLNYSFSLPSILLGTFKKGDKLNVYNIKVETRNNQHPFDTVITEFNYKYIIKCGTTVVATIEGAAKQNNLEFNINDYTNNSLSVEGDYILNMQCQVTLKDSSMYGTFANQMSFYVRKVQTSLNKISTDGAVFASSTDKYSWFGSDKTQITNKGATFRISDNVIQRNILNNNDPDRASTIFGDISSTVPYIINNSLNYYATMNDALIIFSTVLNDNSRRNLYLPIPTNCQGKVYYIKNIQINNTRIMVNGEGKWFMDKSSNGVLEYVDIGDDSAMFISCGFYWIRFI